MPDGRLAFEKGVAVSIEQEVKEAIENAIEGSTATVSGGGGHFVIDGETSAIEAPNEDSTVLQAAHFIDLVACGATVATPACGSAGAIRAIEVVEAVVEAADG